MINWQHVEMANELFGFRLFFEFYVYLSSDVELYYKGGDIMARGVHNAGPVSAKNSQTNSKKDSRLKGRSGPRKRKKK